MQSTTTRKVFIVCVFLRGKKDTRFFQFFSVGDHHHCIASSELSFFFPRCSCSASQTLSFSSHLPRQSAQSAQSNKKRNRVSIKFDESKDGFQQHIIEKNRKIKKPTQFLYLGPFDGTTTAKSGTEKITELSCNQAPKCTMQECRLHAEGLKNEKRFDKS